MVKESTNLASFIHDHMHEWKLSSYVNLSTDTRMFYHLKWSPCIRGSSPQFTQCIALAWGWNQDIMFALTVSMSWTVRVNIKNWGWLDTALSCLIPVLQLGICADSQMNWDILNSSRKLWAAAAAEAIMSLFTACRTKVKLSIWALVSYRTGCSCFFYASSLNFNQCWLPEYQIEPSLVKTSLTVAPLRVQT